ncbi:MAG: DEAD/DEAH box helicase [Kiloniellales bacterium]
MTFDKLGLSADVLRAVTDAGYIEPTPIQEQAIPYVLMGRDILGCAQTGTGKTASFTLPMIDILAAGRARARMPRSLILTPTRELAAQIAENFKTYGKYHKLTMALVIGGVSFARQEQKLDRGVDVLIATPGRLIDHFERGGILLNDVKILVIDEGDRMLDMGFIPDVERIVSYLPKIRQTLFFSATFPPELRRLADNFLINPKEIHVTPPASPAETVDHFLVSAGAKEKRAVLRRLLRREPVQNALIFCNRKRDVDILARSLERHGFSAAALHGDMPQPVRTETLEAFKNGEIIELVATDVAGRGLDIEGLSHVFNFDVPTHAEDYVHRIGRTGRAGRRGRAITLSTPDEHKFLGAITALIGKDIPFLEVPDLIASDGQEGAAEIQPRRKAGNRNGPQRKPKGRREKARKASSKTGERGADPRADGAGRERETAQRKPGDPNNGPRRGRVVGLGDHVPAFLLRPGRTGTGKG